jgi:hypothetical protein
MTVKKLSDSDALLAAAFMQAHVTEAAIQSQRAVMKLLSRVGGV